MEKAGQSAGIGGQPVGSNKTERPCSGRAAQARVPDDFRRKFGGPAEWPPGGKHENCLHSLRHATCHDGRVSDGSTCSRRSPTSSSTRKHSRAESTPMEEIGQTMKSQPSTAIRSADGSMRMVATMCSRSRRAISKGPRQFESSGLPLHADNQTIIKERLYLDRDNGDVLHDEITTIDHALTHLGPSTRCICACAMVDGSRTTVTNTMLMW